jgi:hypothetical protein
MVSCGIYGFGLRGASKNRKIIESSGFPKTCLSFGKAQYPAFYEDNENRGDKKPLARKGPASPIRKVLKSRCD